MKRTGSGTGRFILGLVVLALVLTPVVIAGTRHVLAAETSEKSMFQATLTGDELPSAPSFVRLLRITLQPGAKSPLHTHPGPEVNIVESGELRVFVQGKAFYAEAGDDVDEARPVEADGELVLKKGDRIIYFPETAITFRNASESEKTVLLAAVVLPAGSQHPPGLVWVGREPAPEELAGVSSTILGDGVTTQLPDGNAILSLDTVTLNTGGDLPEQKAGTLMSLARGEFKFMVTKGEVQVSSTANPGPQLPVELNVERKLNRGDAIFFPNGSEKAARTAKAGKVVFIRLQVLPADDTVPMASPEGAVLARIKVAAPVATAVPTVAPTPAPMTEVGPTARVRTTQDNVNMRSETSTSAPIVQQLPEGILLVVTGESVSAEDYTWWPVRLEADETVTGWVVADFIELVPAE